MKIRGWGLYHLYEKNEETTYCSLKKYLFYQGLIRGRRCINFVLNSMKIEVFLSQVSCAVKSFFKFPKLLTDVGLLYKVIPDFIHVTVHEYKHC